MSSGRRAGPYKYLDRGASRSTPQMRGAPPTRGKNGRDRHRTPPGVRNDRSVYVPEIPLNATKYWGTIYGTSGEKIGTAFVGEDAEEPGVVIPLFAKATVPSEGVYWTGSTHLEPE